MYSYFLFGNCFESAPDAPKRSELINFKREGKTIEQHLRNLLCSIVLHISWGNYFALGVQ